MKWILRLAMAGALVGAIAWSVISAATRVQANRAANPVAPASPTGIRGIGYVEPCSEVRKLMLRTGGVIRRCHVRVGDTVRKGELILELDDAVAQAELEVARQTLRLCEAESDDGNAGINPFRIKAVEQAAERLREKLRHYRSESDRYKRMRASQSASLQEYDFVETQRRQTEAELKEQEAEVLHLRNHVTPSAGPCSPPRSSTPAPISDSRKNGSWKRGCRRRSTAPFCGCSNAREKASACSSPSPSFCLGIFRGYE